MNRLPLICTSCQKSLTGGLDTFGDVGQEMCWDCYSSFMEPMEFINVADDEKLKVNDGLIEESKDEWGYER